ncbi:TonB-dependent receptor [Fulvimonas sp. R45]|uniref:TonB-dependent receptor n=1 Tax=Fulvimonas sp. R45 TaxID=3045937 RepID=UPI0026600EE7|nr:TonB-dependent receptor [Fulvimonas sp. R45]MDO1529868.1 TonB-dependent receptor [Fulvimonas sp. R45]
MLAACLLAAASPAAAGPRAVTATAGPATHHVYAIPPGTLDRALETLAAQGSVQVAYAPALVAGKQTRGLSGRYTPSEALGRLLAGTGLAWRALGASGFVLLPGPPVRPVTVRAIPLRASAASAPTLATVAVSGALIGDARVQTATPIFTLTAAQIQARGFDSVADALRNTVFATGSVQGPQVSGSFTQGAQPISLFGLGPQFTLVLVDGKPLARFGRPYNGTTIAASVANLPLSLVDHIDVMAGGGSAIYGSQAIGGVVNIVTRSSLHGSTVDLRVGRYPEGGGASQRMTFTWGREQGRWQATAALEFANVAPIWGYQRPFTTGAGPQGGQPPPQAVILDYGTPASFDQQPQRFLDPPAGCDSSLYDGSTVLAGNSRVGHYCGSLRSNAYRTYGNQQRSYDGLVKLRYLASDHLRLYADVMGNWQEQRWYTGPTAWSSDNLPGGAIEDAASRRILYPVRTFAPEEVPDGAPGQMTRQRDLLYQADLGANGRFGDSGWTWDLYHLRSGDRTHVEEPLLVTPRVDAFFDTLLDATGATDPATGLQLYRPDYNAFFQGLSPAQYAGFAQDADEASDTRIDTTRLTMGNTAWFNLPGGGASFAALAEAGGESWHEPIDPLFTDQLAFGHAASGGGGHRTHAATAFELNLPLLKPLTLDLSGRYDRYAGAGHTNRRFTYRLGVEYRPLDELLLRANYTTAFKAPDLSALFLSPSGYYIPVTDYYRCALAGETQCADYTYQVRGTTLANPALKPTDARSWTLGAAWSPTGRLDLSLDYLDIAIRNEEVEQDVNLLAYDEARCRLGQLDPASARCRALTDPVDGQVRRPMAGGPIDSVVTTYVNLSSETVHSLFASLRYRFAPTRLGSLRLELDWNDLLSHDFRFAAGMPKVRQLADPRSSTEFKSMFTGALDWTSPGGAWTSTLYGRRYGATPNYAATLYGAGYAGAARLHPWITFNWTLGYTPTRRLAFALTVDNLANTMPPRDRTYGAYPYFNDENYDIYGRQILLRARLAFDAR